MGFLSWLFGKGKRNSGKQRVGQSAPSHAPASRPTPARLDASLGSRTSRTAPAGTAAHDARWIAPGQSGTIHGITIPTGMIYVGSQSHPGWRDDPSLIRPGGAVRAGVPDKLPYYPRWAGFDPVQRHTYLSWLASGRTAPLTDPGYVFVFLYGLERRFFIDLLPHLHANEAFTEAQQIRTEIAALIDRYGDLARSLADHGAELLDTIDVASAMHLLQPAFIPPRLSGSRSTPPLALRAMIGISSRDQQPLPADWALAWAWFYPETRLRTPARRCPDELQALFRIRYHESFGAGLIPRAAAAELRMTHRPLNMTLSEQHVRSTSIPNTFDLKTDARKLIRLLDEVTTELDSFSRWIGRTGNNPNSLEGASLLPAELISRTEPRFEPFDRWIRQHLVNPRGTQIDTTSLIGRWTSGTTEKLNRAQSASLATMLEALGYGIEPDVRFGGPALKAAEPAVLFALDDTSLREPSPGYPLARTMVHLAAAVSAADSSITAPEVEALGSYVDKVLGISGQEQKRLYAYLAWLNCQPVRLTGLQRQIREMSAEQRAATGDLLVTIAAADGSASPAEIRLLTRIYRMLELESDTLTSHLHTALTGRPGTAVARPATTAPSLSLDPALIARKQRETAEVSTLLAEVFAEDADEEPVAAEPAEPLDAQLPGSDAVTAPVEGLDDAHATLLRTIVTRESWERHQFTRMTDDLGLMPDGAIDMLNEFALDTTGDVLIEGDDPLEILEYTRQELAL